MNTGRINLLKRLALLRFGIIISLPVLLFFIFSCSEDRVGQFPTDKTPPPPISNVVVEPLPGGARISYDLPRESDISYVKCEFMFQGAKKIVRSSVYQNYLLIEGLPDVETCDITLYLVDHSENQSTPVTYTFTPLEPPFVTIFKTLEVTADFGGVVVTWENNTSSLMGIFMFAANDEGELVEQDLVFSSQKNEKRAIRGFNTDERVFAFTITDKYGNSSDTLKVTRAPLFEKEIDKGGFKDAHLLGDNFSVSNGRPISNIWDGDVTTIWHTLADAGYTVPQYFSIDLGVEAMLSRFVLWSRGEIYYYGQHNIRYFEVWATNELKRPIDDEYWSNNDWRADWVMLGDFEVVKPSGSPAGTNTDEDIAYQDAGFEFVFDPGVGKMRYVRFVVKETWARTPALHVAEVAFYGDDTE